MSLHNACERRARLLASLRPFFEGGEEKRWHDPTRDCRVQHIMHAPNRCSPTITIIEIRFKVDLRRQGFWVTETVFPTLPSHSCARWVLGGRPRLGGFMQKCLRACNCALNYTGNIDGNANNTPGYLEPQKWVVVIGRFTRSWGNDYER